MATETPLQPSRVLVKSLWSAITALVLAACSSNGQQEPGPPDDGVVQVQSALSTGDTCGDQCGGDTLALGEACCRNGPQTAYAVDQECCTPSGVQPKYPIADLNACPNRVPHAGHVLTTNGCSVQAPLAAAVANGGLLTGTALAFYSNVFYPACNVHDSCYGTCNAGSETDDSIKATCDFSFRENTRQTCMLRFAGRPLARAACLRAASAFYRGVRLGGGPFYATAQGEACDCCAGDVSCAAQEADLAVLLASPSLPSPGSTTEPGFSEPLEFQFENRGPADARPAVVRIGLSGPIYEVSASARVLPGDPSGPWVDCEDSAGDLLCDLSALPIPTGSWIVVVGDLTASEPGSVRLSAQAISGVSDPDTSNNQGVAGWHFKCPDDFPYWNDTVEERACEPCPPNTAWDPATQKCTSQGAVRLTAQRVYCTGAPSWQDVFTSGGGVGLVLYRALDPDWTSWEEIRAVAGAAGEYLFSNLDPGLYESCSAWRIGDDGLPTWDNGWLADPNAIWNETCNDVFTVEAGVTATGTVIAGDGCED